MNEKPIDLTKPVYELCSQYPELPQILAGLGFKDITKPGMLISVGRFMTLQKGAAAKKIDFGQIKAKLEEQGFHCI